MPQLRAAWEFSTQAQAPALDGKTRRALSFCRGRVTSEGCIVGLLYSDWPLFALQSLLARSLPFHNNHVHVRARAPGLSKAEGASERARGGSDLLAAKEYAYAG